MNESIPLTPDQARGITNLIGMVQQAYPLEDLSGERAEEVLTAYAEPVSAAVNEGPTAHQMLEYDVRVHVPLSVDGRGHIDHARANYVAVVESGALQVENMERGEAHYYAPGSWGHAHRIRTEAADAG